MFPYYIILNNISFEGQNSQKLDEDEGRNFSLITCNLKKKKKRKTFFFFSIFINIYFIT